ncbi:type 11 methyltransferase [Natrialba chahannaoensis JCM 10990]|uniref:Type 11 methyltransferase n=1 Tax=Natrialba chahannaoensis JCM 10990 TaxID=1227492 RepID=M0AD82_9EURY|nr:class I SAM-dependent methyltransferase [Natrialba chahannaoensis]ELY96710.1 type 11 methyltransferase [Natrialba chahannaoensis JCM 10990]
MERSHRQSLPKPFQKHLSNTEIQKTSILHSFDAVRQQLTLLKKNKSSINTILDVGCNRGGLVAGLAEYLSANEVYGIDTDPTLRDEASNSGITVYDINAENDTFPFADSSIDLVLSFGLLEHLRYYDNLFSEVSRVLRDGWFWIATPNLGSWINRFSLLTGHQPRNVEVSSERAVGTLPVYDDNEFINHVHAPTYKALLELFDQYEFDTVNSVPLSPYQRSRLTRLLDWIFEHRTSWGRRVAVLAKQR